MASVFENYDNEVGALLLTASRSIASSLAPSTSSPTTSLDAADRAIVEAGEVVESMSLEAATGTGDLRAFQRERITARQREVSRAKRELRDARDRLARVANEEERTALFGDSEAVAERVRLVEETTALQRGGDHIMDSRRNIAQTEAIGAGILEDLQLQRATINRARDTVVRIDDGIDSSSSIISSMNRRAFMNKIVVYGVFAAVVVTILGVLYFRLFPAQPVVVVAK